MSRRQPRVDAVFAALADPTRRALLDQLAGTPAVSATELAAPLPVTRQAVAKHLRALSDAGLVTARRAGREVQWELDPAPFQDVLGWIVDVGGQWDRRLARLRDQLEGRR